MTFEQMLYLDGRLLAIRDEAIKISKQQKFSPDRNYCKTQTWHALPRERGLIGLKYLLAQVVGFGARVEALSTPEAYDRAYQTIWGTLPPCAKGKKCQCKQDYAVPALTPEELRRVDAGTLVVLKRDPDFEFAPPDDKFAPHDLDAMVDEVFPEAVGA